MRTTGRFAAAIAALIVATGLALAAENNEEAQPEEPPPGKDSEEQVQMKNILVTGKRAKKPTGPKVFTPAEIDAPRLSNTADGLMENTAGVNLSRQRYSGNENQRLNIRGFDESRSRIMLNGRNLNGAGVYGGYYVDWDSLALDDVERVELIRGAGPARYGNTLGGVLNIETKRGAVEPETTVRVRGGLIDEDAREDMWDGSVSHRGCTGPLLYTVSAAHHDSDGFLRNAWSNRELFSGGLTWQVTPELDVELAGRYNVNESGMIVYNRPDSPFFDDDEPTSLGSFLGGPGLPFADAPFEPGDGSFWRDKRLNLDTGLS